ncbi:MAG: helix-turn-helix domain-containing protein [Eubacterium sp.]
MKNKKIAQVLKQYRNDNNLKVQDVARLLKERSVSVADKTIYGWESGQTQPDADTLLILCDIYNIDNILSTFGYNDKKTFTVTKYEEELIMSYRKHPEIQYAIKKLLDLDKH